MSMTPFIIIIIIGWQRTMAAKTNRDARAREGFLAVCVALRVRNNGVETWVKRRRRSDAVNQRRSPNNRSRNGRGQKYLIRGVDLRFRWFFPVAFHRDETAKTTATIDVASCLPSKKTYSNATRPRVHHILLLLLLLLYARNVRARSIYTILPIDYISV